MNLTEKDTSPKISATWGFIAGMALFAVACSFLCLDIIGLLRGEIWKLSRHHPGLVTRADHADSFWLSVIVSFIVGLILLGNALWILRSAFRKTIR
jgi:hypothetical protein